MKISDQYHKWVEWSAEDDAYIGKCPDLITGIHGDDPLKIFNELCQVAEEVIRGPAGRSPHPGAEDCECLGRHVSW